MRKYKIFDCTINAENDDEAIDWASGFVFMECEITVGKLPLYHRYIATVQGDVDVYYDFGADYYFFVEQGEVDEVHGNDTEVDDE